VNLNTNVIQIKSINMSQRASELRDAAHLQSAEIREPQQADGAPTTDGKAPDLHKLQIEHLWKEVLGRLNPLQQTAESEFSLLASALAYANKQSPGVSDRVTLNDGIALISGVLRCISIANNNTYHVKVVDQNGTMHTMVEEITPGPSSSVLSNPKTIVRVGPSAGTVKEVAAAIAAVTPKMPPIVVNAPTTSGTAAPKRTAKKPKSKGPKSSSQSPSKGPRKNAATKVEGGKKEGAVSPPLTQEQKDRRKFLQSCLRAAKGKDWAAVLSYYKKDEKAIREMVDKADHTRVICGEASVPPLERLGIIDFLEPLPAGASWADASDVCDLVDKLIARAKARFLASKKPKPIPVTKDTFVATYRDLKCAVPLSYKDAVMSGRAMIARSLGMENAPLIGLKFIRNEKGRAIYVASWKHSGGGKKNTVLGFLRPSVRMGPDIETVAHPQIADDDWLLHDNFKRVVPAVGLDPGGTG